MNSESTQGEQSRKSLGGADLRGHPFLCPVPRWRREYTRRVESEYGSRVLTRKRQVVRDPTERPMSLFPSKDGASPRVRYPTTTSLSLLSSTTHPLQKSESPGCTVVTVRRVLSVVVFRFTGPSSLETEGPLPR